MLKLKFKEATKKVIVYFRHSAEDKQENSVAIQREQVQGFATQNNLEIIEEFADEGYTGLNANRPAFQRMFNEWIMNPNMQSFDYILVYDESRWGRFQNTDEAAYYQFLCERYGKKVIFIVNGFPKEENRMLLNLNTAVKRHMAAEYSRELSTKVFYGCVKVSQQGYSAGGTACYGMIRLLLDESKKPVRILKKGEHKAISNARVTFTSCNDDATKAVQRIFRLYVDEWKKPEGIASILNEEGSRSANGGLWNRDKIMRILTNETYIGTRIYNKTSNRLKQGWHSNPRSEWIICPNAFPVIIQPEVFYNAQERLYWSTSSQWKRGIYSIRKAHHILTEEIEKLLQNRGVHQDDVFTVLQDFPVLYGSAFYIDSAIPHWCFLIPDKLRQYQHVLGIGIDLDKRQYPIDQVFMLPTEAFSMGNYRVFSQQDNAYLSYVIQDDKIEDKIFNVVQELGISSRQPTEM